MSHSHAYLSVLYYPYISQSFTSLPLSALIYLSWITSPKFISLSFHGLNLRGGFLAALGMSLDTFEFFFPWHLESHLICYNLSLLMQHCLFTLLDQGTYQHQEEKKKEIMLLELPSNHLTSEQNILFSTQLKMLKHFVDINPEEATASASYRYAHRLHSSCPEILQENSDIWFCI